jgi:hypothetical protein
MIKWTNGTMLHPIICAAIIDDDYTRGASAYSVTQLIDSPYRVRLINELSADPNVELEQEIGDMIYALFGKLVHGMLENGFVKMSGRKAEQVKALCPGEYQVDVEDRLFCEDLGVVWSGQYDVLYNLNGRNILEDHKVVSINEFSMQRQEAKWEQQLNLLALLVRRNGGTVDELAINCYYRDWSKAKAAYDRTGDYPQHQTIRVPIRLWSQEKQQAFLDYRLEMHLYEADKGCSPKDRWMSEDVWKVMLPGAKKSSRNLPAKAAAEKWVSEQKEPKFRKAEIVHFEGVSIRCQFYCAAAPHCPHYKELNTGKFGGIIHESENE